MSCIVRRLIVRNRIALALVEIHNPTWDDIEVSVQRLNKFRNLSELTTSQLDRLFQPQNMPSARSICGNNRPPIERDSAAHDRPFCCEGGDAFSALQIPYS